jgi:hypothetical protein
LRPVHRRSHQPHHHESAAQLIAGSAWPTQAHGAVPMEPTSPETPHESAPSAHPDLAGGSGGGVGG